jgi:hypothetical protein
MIFGRLAITQADGQQTIATLNKSTVRIGRAPDNDIVLDDDQVAPYHAQVLCDARGCQILDLGSAGGTVVDGANLARQQPQQLPDNAVIQIGRARMTFSVDGSGRDSTTAKLISSRANEDLLSSLLGAGGPRATPAMGTPQAPGDAPTEAMPVLPSGPQVRLSINPTDLKVDAGGIVTLTATIVNTSRIVDRIDLSVDGIEAAWVKIVPPSHRLRPGEKAESQIVIAPPRAPTSTAGIYRFSVVARAAQRPGDAITAEAELTVLPFSEFRFEMLPPKEQTGWWQANYTMRLVNRGNSAQPFELQGANDENVFTFQTTPPAPVVAAGKEAKLRLATRLRLARWFGRPKTYTFTVSATPVDATAPTQQVDGRFIQEPPLKWWLLLLMAALVTLSLLACLLSLLLPFILAWFRREPQPVTPTAQVGIVAPAPSALVPNAAATGEALAAAQQATVAAQSTAFAQTAQALVGANGETQTAFALGVAQTQAGVTLGFAQTQTAIAVVGGGTATAQAILNATNAALLAAQGTAKANTDATLTALPNANAATLTAVAESFNTTRTAEALALTQTALARPTDTPTLTPTPTPAADILVTFDPVEEPTAIHGDAFVDRGLLFCFYHIGEPATSPPEGEPDCDPSRINRAIGISFKTNAAIQQPSLFQDLPFVYPAGVSANGPAAALTSQFAQCQDYSGYGCESPGGPVPRSIMVINFPQRSVANVRLDFWLPPDVTESPPGAIYYLIAFDGEGNIVARSDTGALTVPAYYPISVQSPSPRIQQVILFVDTQRTQVPLFITRIAANYSP